MVEASAARLVRVEYAGQRIQGQTTEVERKSDGKEEELREGADRDFDFASPPWDCPSRPSRPFVAW